MSQCWRNSLLVLITSFSCACAITARYGLLGPSGCGKTTLLRSIIGFIKPSEGTVRVFGREPKVSGFGLQGPLIGYMPQDIALLPELTIEETFQYYGRILLMEEDKLNERMENLFNVLQLPIKNRKIRDLSGGQKRRISMGIAIIHHPPLVILDEPTVGVDPILRKRIWAHLLELSSEKNCTILLTTHCYEEARKAHILSFMRHGHLLTQSNTQELFHTFNTDCIDAIFWKLCYNDKISNNVEGRQSATEVIGRYKMLPIDIEDLNTTNIVLKDKIDRSMHQQTTSFPVLKRLLANARKSMLYILRNNIVGGIIIFFPVIQLILGYCVWSDRIHGLALSIVNEDKGQLGNQFLKYLDSYVIVQHQHTSIEKAFNSAQNGETLGVMHVRENFTNSYKTRIQDGIWASDETLDSSEIKVNIAMTNPILSYVVTGELYRAYLEFLKDYVNEIQYKVTAVQPPIVFGNPIYGEQEPHFRMAAAPFFIIGLTYLTSACIASVTLIAERKYGTYERSWISGLTTAEFMLSNVLVQLIIILVQSAVIFNFTIWIFPLPVKGSSVLATLMTIMQGICGMMHGFLISTICKDEAAVFAGIIGTVFPFLVIGGYIWPVEGMPLWIQYISYCTPLSIPCDAMRSIINRGLDLRNYIVYMGFVVTNAWIILLFLLSFTLLHVYW